MPSFKVIISGGGTGGHVFPAIAIANALKEKVKKLRFCLLEQRKNGNGKSSQSRIFNQRIVD